jgi:hypothetical protein
MSYHITWKKKNLCSHTPGYLRHLLQKQLENALNIYTELVILVLQKQMILQTRHKKGNKLILIKINAGSPSYQK